MKKILSFILVGAMLLSLAACSEDAGEKSKYKNGSNIVEDGGINIGESAETQIGEYITFGKYEQDNDTSNGKEDIEWLVLDKEDDKILVISKCGLDSQLYNNVEREDTAWETCTLRRWLNEEFINEAFTSSEQSQIPTITVNADANPDCETDPGNNTQDKVFLLSIEEANEYFASDDDRKCQATDYAAAQGVYGSETSGFEGNCWWWLRSPGFRQDYAASVGTYGFVYLRGDYVCESNIAVRPAMWIEL